MESTSSSSSSIQKSFTYDVFLSFRGEDTRKNFVDHLYYALKQKGIVTYKDDENIKKGKRINEQLIKSIEDSRCYIIVFSKNYASSSWCLDELVKIMECQKMTEHTAYPIFYDVEPTEVRKQSGSVGEAFARYEKEEAAGKWRDALKEAADLAGSELKNTLDGREAKFIQKLVQEISLDLRFNNFILDEKLIGMETRIRDVVSSLEINVDDVRMLGIKGMGGIGKTTLARAVFDQLSSQFEGQSFVENVREESKPSLSGLKSLQKQVLSDILNDQVTVSGVHEGRNKMKNRMRARKVLIVLDDVDNTNQLEALAGDPNWFKSGSRIIITTRDEQVLVAHRVSLIYNVNILSHAEAICLFSRYAFGKEIPVQGYKELSEEVIEYAAGLPLTITVLGSLLCGQDESVWKDAIKRLQTIPLKATMEKLEISFDGLENDYKEIFLDVACILKDWSKKDAIKVLECCGFRAIYGLRVLEQKSLITYNEEEELVMHDHLEEMGRNIVRRSHPDEPQRHSRLWVDEEIEYILTNDLGTQATKCLRFESWDLSAEIVVKGLAKMKDLRFIHIVDYVKNNIVQFDKVSEYLPSSLRFMRWVGFPFSSLPNTFQGKYLVGLEMVESKIVQLWKDGEEKVLHKLRFLTFKRSKLQTFDLNLAPNLEQLTIENCCDFVELHIPVDQHPKLGYLNLSFLKLTTLHLGNIPNLKTLDLHDSHLVELQMPAESPKLEWVNLSQSKLTNLHLGNTPNLKILILSGCHDLVEFQMPAESLKLEYLDLTKSKLTNLHLGNTPNLKWLDLKNCYDLVEFQMPAESLKLEHLDLTYSKLKNLHLGNTPNLERLILEGCNDLVELQMPSESLKLKHLDLTDSKMTNLYLGITPKLDKLILRGCRDLVEFQTPAESLKLKHPDLTYSKLKNLHLGKTPNLERLILKGCNDLVELQMPAESLKLKHLDLTDSKLTNLHLGNTPNLGWLILEGCNDLVELQMPAESLKLEELNLSHSKLRTLDLGLTPNLKRLILENCCNLVKINVPIGCLRNLAFLDLSGCGRFKSFVFKKWSQAAEAGSLSELHLIAEPTDVCPLHSENDSPKFQFLCYYKEDSASSSGNIERLISIELCACTNLESFSRSICSLRGFRKLTLEGSIPEAPKDLNQLEYLEELSLWSTDIKSLPDSICVLKHIKSLEIKSCYLLEMLPEDIGRLECLERLILMGCILLRNIPNSICEMKRLECLCLPYCILLEKLPEELGHLECLKELDIEGTNICLFPQSIFKLKGRLRIIGDRWLLESCGLTTKRRRMSDEDSDNDDDDEMVCDL